MSFFHPEVRRDRITEIDTDLLHGIKVKGLIVDLDNTLGGYDDPLPPADVVGWVKIVSDAGFKMYIVSNNSHKARVSAYGEALGLPWKRIALKPLPFKMIAAKHEMGLKRGEICAVGDQTRTDVLGARLAGMKAALVTPVAKLKKLGKL